MQRLSGNRRSETKRIVFLNNVYCQKAGRSDQGFKPLTSVEGHPEVAARYFSVLPTVFSSRNALLQLYYAGRDEID
ncbi:hypothetical protein ILFOPFJJ_05863 [Ensifer psoraleae]|nr:hypothetical protein [Sinorhizobium psoraleae]